MIDTENKGARLLDMYERLIHGEVISKKRTGGNLWCHGQDYPARHQ